MAFDPYRPLPRKTEFDIRASGAGDASPSRLRAALVLGALGACIVYALTDSWWLGAWPLCLAIFALHGLSSQFQYELDLRHDAAPVVRRVLHLSRVSLKILWAVTALAGLTLLLGTTLEWEWVMELLGR
ncbi:MAG TPA: hypothetical protein VKA84_01140 [Gemmatimonadaceae bacterium]|nr:hypothetical protein [Gemmatimonadaceae bacterium]